MENELSRLVDALPGLVWTALLDGSGDFVNQRWCDYTGLTREEASGPGWLTAVHPDDHCELLPRWKAIVASGKAGEVEARMRRFDGEYRWFSFSAQPLTDGSGKVVKWCGINTDIEDRRRAEQALRADEYRYRVIVDGLPAIVTLMTADGQFAHANLHMLEYLGTTLEEMQLATRPLGKAFHPDDRPGVLVRWFESVASGHPFDCEARLRRADGVYRWFHARGLPLRDAQGRILLWYLLQTDVDERKRAEDLLAGEKRLLEMVARGDPSGAILDALCRLVESTAPDCYCSVLLTDASGTRAENVAAPSLPSTFTNAIIDRAINLETGPCGMATYLNEQIVSTDLTSEKRWPTWCPVALAHGLQACWSTPITSAAGKALGAFAIYHKGPATPTPLLQGLIEQFTHVASIAVERVQKDAALKRSEALLSQAQRLSSTGSLGCDVATDEHSWSRETFHIFGYEPSTTISFQLILARVHPEDRSLMTRAFAQAAEGHGCECECECRLLMPDGRLKHVQIVAHGSRNDTGRVECFGAVQDVTERRVAEEALDRVRSDLAHVSRVMSLGALTASIAHEINQPLSGIVTNAGTCLRMLAAEPPNLDGARETARRIIRDGNRASGVITGLRALFAKREVSTEPVDINEATKEVVALSSNELQRARVVLHTKFADGLPRVQGDRVQLQQVILNLLLNAAEAMNGVDDRDRRLVIRTEQDVDGSVILLVEDTGVGLPPADAELLFESFHTTKRDGMGIGLSVSRSIIEGHHGRLWATRNADHGATFAFSIPHEGSPVMGAVSESRTDT